MILIRLFVLLAIITLSSLCYATTYYLRSDGTAADKESATSCGSASTAMSIETHNSQTYSGDDVLYLCSGTYSGTNLLPPSSGTSGHPIIYDAEVSSVTINAVFDIDNKDYINVRNITLTVDPEASSVNMYIRYGADHINIDNVTFNGGQGVMIYGASYVNITNSSFDGYATTYDDLLAIKSSSGYDSTYITIDNCTFTEGTAMLSVGSRVDVGSTVDHIIMTNCVGTQLWTMFYIKPGAVGGMPGGGTISNISVSNCDLVTTVGRYNFGNLLMLDTDAGDNTTISNISMDQCTLSARTDAGSGNSAFVEIMQRTADTGEQVDNIDITNCTCLDPGSGGSQQIDYGLYVDGDTSLTNVTINNTIFDGAYTMLSDGASTFTDPVELSGITFKNYTRFENDFDAPIQVVYSTTDRKIAVIGDGFTIYNMSIYGGIWFGASATLKNTIAYSDASNGSEMGYDGNCSSLITEENDTDGWTNVGLATFESSNTFAQNGTYSFHGIADANADAAYLTLPTVTIGQAYELSFYYRTPVHVIDVRVGTSSAGLEYADIADLSSPSSWTQQTVNFVATSTLLYLRITEGDTNNDAEFYIDSVSLKTASGLDILVNSGKTVIGTTNLFKDAAKTGRGTYSDTGTIFNSDPLFVNASGGNFHLQSTSPAINAGTDVGLTQDFVGNPVPSYTGDNPDIGGYEWKKDKIRTPLSLQPHLRGRRRR